MIILYGNYKPDVHESAFVAPGAFIIGNVVIEEYSTVWFNAVLRGDEDLIKIGKRTSIQDNTTLHSYKGNPVIIGDGVTVGHNAILHGCKIGKKSIVGMGSTILDGAEIGEECIIGANTLIPPGKKIPPRSLVMGSPGKVVRELNEKDLESIQLSAEAYVQKGKEYEEILALSK